MVATAPLSALSWPGPQPDPVLVLERPAYVRSIRLARPNVDYHQDASWLRKLLCDVRRKTGQRRLSPAHGWDNAGLLREAVGPQREDVLENLFQMAGWRSGRSGDEPISNGDLPRYPRESKTGA